MRAPLLMLLIALCGCPQSVGDRAFEDGAGGGGNGSSSGSGGENGGTSLPPNCSIDSDCMPAAPKCCDCPTHAVPDDDPAQNACLDVVCGPMSCGSPTVAVCNAGRCALECAPVACDANVVCPSGYATDANGCLTCGCAGAAELGMDCVGDGDCARVQDDCCGCENGGFDTSVPTSQVASHNTMLACPANPICPGQDTCAADLAPRCVQGLCALVAGPLPPNACGRGGLAACAGGEACYVNANDQATMHGVGICQP